MNDLGQILLLSIDQRDLVVTTTAEKKLLTNMI